MGLGYLGFDTVMCFICEHQWDATEGILGEETELPEGEEAESEFVQDLPIVVASILAPVCGLSLVSFCFGESDLPLVAGHGGCCRRS